jgi:hypothetical protein
LLQSTKPVKELIGDYIANMKYKMNAEKKVTGIINEAPVLPNENDLTEEDYETYVPNSPEYNPESPEYNPESPDYNPESPDYNPDSPDYNPDSPDYNPDSPDYNPESPDTPENLIRIQQPSGTINVRMRFDSEFLNYIFTNMPKDDKLQLLSKPENEQIDELKELYKKEFETYPSQKQEYVLNKLAYKNYEYDVYNLANYLTNGNKGKGIEGNNEKEFIVSEEIFDKPLIKKPAIEETSILEVEPEPEVVNSSEENNSDNTEGKTVSFDTGSSNESSSETRKITL